MLLGTDAVRAFSSDFRGISLHTADVDSGALRVREVEMWQAESASHNFSNYAAKMSI